MTHCATRPTYCLLLASLIVLSSGCSDSGGGSAISSPPESDAGGLPFALADENGTSDVARLGYPEVRDLSRDLATGRFLDRYFDIDSAVAALAIEAADAEENSDYPCPDGGTVNANRISRNGPIPSHVATFADCSLESRTLSGSLTREVNPGVIGSGSYIAITATFEALEIRSGDSERLLISGTAMRQRTDGSAAVGVERGSCTLEEDNRSLIEGSSITSALIEESGIAGSITVSDYSHDRWDARFHDASSNAPLCPLTIAQRESASLKAHFDHYSNSAINGTASVTSSISIGMADAMDAASQTSVLPDGSSVTLTALQDQAGKVQVDIVSEGSAISFIDDHVFPSQDFVLSF
ncbi:hypothetical protein ACUNV4_07990 [Granulosicoccus sp. 3-233]|uniref:hypothetical protein n=1 Tax=Granulosicoccus sp. 3-233 TaxID=3417969 RepID=UPI003D3313BB